MPFFDQDTKDIITKCSLNSLLDYEIIKREGNWGDIEGIRDLVGQVLNAVINDPKISIQNQSEICIVLSSDRDIQSLNRTYRGKNNPTNVLSFSSPKKGSFQAHNFIGDIVLAQETIEREAFENNISFAHHLSHLIIHGLLHLMGYDHETEREARNMEELEISILSRLGISDPYKKKPQRCSQFYSKKFENH